MAQNNMANMISNHHNNNNRRGFNNAKNTGTGGVGVGVGVAGNNLSNTRADSAHNLRDICNMLNSSSVLPVGESAYDHIITMMRGLDLQDDGIIMNHKIKTIETDFCNIVRDESMLCESMEYINEKALVDGETALKFAMLFSSRNFDALAMKETKVRSAMLKILETNFLNADTYRVHDKNRLYNSITLLGEYYHRVRLADNSPIIILGESLLSLLIREVSDLAEIDTRLARLILSQVTLNGDIMRTRHKAELTQLLFHIRRNLIEQPTLKAAVKALLLMTLDLYYSNFTNLGAQLEEMYTKYLIQEDEEEGNNNFETQSSSSQSQSVHLQQRNSSTKLSTQQNQQVNYNSSQNQQGSSNTYSDERNSSFENGISSDPANDSFELQPTTKKWSEQVCEDSFCDNEFGENEVVTNKSSECSPEQEQNLNSSYSEQDNLLSTSSRYDNERSSSRNSARSYQQHGSPRKLKHQHEEKAAYGTNEEEDETKPLPRWRAPRFNRNENNEYNGRIRNQQRRYSASFDDDQHSVRSDGGSLRLYSINDRLKHSQERFDRSTGANNYNSIVNSNWDRQSQRDDRSERSYVSNYERGNYKRGGRYNNRNTYDKPPRFQKNQQHQHQHQHHQQQQHQSHPKQYNNNKDNQKIHSETWRRSNSSINNAQQDENCSFNSNGPESHSRSSSRARTLPRPAKSHMEGGSRKQQNPTNYHHSQSPSRKGGRHADAGQQQTQQQQHQHQRYPRNYNNARYGSQSSLASEASSTLDRRHHQRNRNFTRRSRQDNNNSQEERPANSSERNKVQTENTWNTKEESELVRNAQQTTKYMNYLSSQK